MSTQKTNHDVRSEHLPKSKDTFDSKSSVLGYTHLSISVADVMLNNSQFPVLAEKALFKETIEEMSRSNLGIACLVDHSGILTGIITDGDVRRKLLKTQKPLSAFFVDDAIEHAIKNPTTTSPFETLACAIRTMGQKRIWDLPVVTGDGKLEGLLHLHPAIEILLDELSRK